MTTFRNYTQKDLGDALKGVPCGLSALDVDKIWAEHQTSEEWGRIEAPKDYALPTVSAKDVAEELGRVAALRRPTHGTPKEL